MRPAWSDPASTAGAAVLAGVVAVGVDVIAGGDAAHTVALGPLALVLGVLRLRAPERGRSMNAAATVALLSQPVLHATLTLIPTVPHGSGTALAPHALADAPTTLTQLLVAAVIIMAVISAEPLLRQCCRWQPCTLVRPFSRRDERTTPSSLPNPDLSHRRRVRRGTGQRIRLRAPPLTLAPA